MESTIDWNKEANELKQREERNWWKPSPGQYTVNFLSNGEKYITQWEDKTIAKVHFIIEVNELKGDQVVRNQYDWGVTQGETPNSLFGQIALIGKNANGQLMGGNITLIIKGEGKERNYTVLEAIPLTPKKTETV